MPVHDWARVDAGTFHAFHTSWITHLMEALNGGVLPSGYYALSEQVATRMQTDVLTLRTLDPDQVGDSDRGVALLETRPSVRLSVRPDPARRPRRLSRRGRHLVIRHLSGHQVIALIEIVSPANKDRKAHVRELAEKVVRSLETGIHILLLDLLPPGSHDPQGLHSVIWSYFDTATYSPPSAEPFTLASYMWNGLEPTVFLEPVALAQSLIDMPLFLTAERYINVPLETTYLAAYRGLPSFWRGVIEQGSAPPEASA